MQRAQPEVAISIADTTLTLDKLKRVSKRRAKASRMPYRMEKMALMWGTENASSPTS